MFEKTLRKAMIARNVSVAELARRTELSRKTIEHYLEGRTEPTVSGLIKIGEALNVSPVALVSNKAYADNFKAERITRDLKDEIGKLMDGINDKSIVGGVIREEKLRIIDDLRTIIERAEK